MAFAVKYSKKFQQGKVVPTTYRVDILSEAGGPVITPDKMSADPLHYRTLSQSKGEYKCVIGSEIFFEFVLIKHNNEADYDALLESEYREHIVKFYNDDTTDLIWQGYLQPENIYKSVFDANVHIYLSASDGLKDLANYDFRTTAGALYTERLTGLYIIRLALNYLNQDSQFEFPFVIKLGTKHTGEGANDNPLQDVSHDCRRFIKYQSGKTVVDDCLTVIEKVLEPYNCTMMQIAGEYRIQHRRENDSEDYTYTWNRVFQNCLPADDIVNIDSYTYKRGAELSMLSPVKEMSIRLLNGSLGDYLVADLDDFSGAGPWDLTDFTPDDPVAEDGNTQLHCYITDDNEGHRVITLSSDIALTKDTEADYIKLKFQYRADLTLTDFLNIPKFYVNVVKPSGTQSHWEYGMTDPWQWFESPNSDVFKVDEDGDYNIQIIMVESDHASAPYSEEAYIRDVSLVKIVALEEATFTDITLDDYYRAISTKGKVVDETIDMFFGDSFNPNDMAALIYGGLNTEEWDRYGHNDDTWLLRLRALDYLSMRQDYLEHIILSVKDPGDNIFPHNIIQLNSKNYTILSYDKSFRTQWINLHLLERLDTDATMTFIQSKLTSIDGEDATNTQPVVISEGVTGDTYWGTITGTMADQADLTAALNLKAPVDNPTFTTKVTTPALKVTTGAGVNKILISDAAGDLTYLATTGTGSAARAISPTFTGTVGAAAITATGIITGGALRTNGTTTDYSFIYRDSANYALYVNTSSADIASFRYGANTATGGTAVLLIDNTGMQFAGQMLINDGGSIGQAAGPLLTFDDSNNYLEITGCNVGIGTDAPSKKLHVYAGASGASENALTNLIIEDSGTNILSLLTPNDAVAGIMFADPESEFAGYVRYDHDDDTMKFYTDATPKITISSSGELYQPNFTSGWDGTNWQITAAGAAEFESMRVRGALNVYEMIINQLRYQDGGIVMGSGGGKISAISDATQGAEVMTFEDPDGSSAVPFVEGAIVLLQEFDIDKTTVIKQLVREVDDVTGANVTMKAAAGWTPAVDDNGAFEAGDVVVAIGNTDGVTYPDLQNIIYLSATDADSPFIRMHAGIDSWADFSSFDNATLKLLIGNLDGIAGYDIVGANPGFGLYSSNAFLSGKIVATSGYIGGTNGWVIETGKMTSTGIGLATTTGDATYAMWAGDNTPANAEFRVKHDGSCYAKGYCEFGGTSGSVSLGLTGDRGMISAYSHLQIYGLFSKWGYSVESDINLSTIDYPFYYLNASDVSKTLTLPSSAELVSQAIGENVIVVFFNPTKGTFTIDGDDLDIIISGSLVGSFDLDENETKTLMYFNHGVYQYWFEL